MTISKLKLPVLEYFAPYTIRRGEEAFFPFIDQKSNTLYEQWHCEDYSIPSGSGIWTALSTAPNLVGDLFVGYSAKDLLSFCHFHTSWLNNTLPVAFAAVGLVPSLSQISLLQRQFPSARFHTVFDACVLGSVADCMVASWLRGQTASFLLEEDKLIACYGKKSRCFQNDVFSLNKFKEHFGVKSTVRTHKPKSPHMSFYQQASFLQATP